MASEEMAINDDVKMTNPPAMAVPEAVAQVQGNNEGENRLIEICKEILSMDDNFTQGALRLYQETFSLMTEGVSLGTQPQENDHFCKAAVLYVTKKLARERPGITLSQVLQATNVGAVEFFKEIPQYLLKCGPVLKNIYGAEFEKDLLAKEEKASFVQLIGLFRYYKRIYFEFFGNTGSEGKVADELRFGWVLFISIRLQLGKFIDMVTCTHALLAIMALLIVHIPTSLRKFDYALLSKKDATGVRIIASLSQKEQASEADVKTMVDKAHAMLASVFESLPARKEHSGIERLSGLSTESEGLVYFEGLMDEGTLATNLQTLEKVYDDVHQNQGELDERVVIYADEGCENISLSGLSGGATQNGRSLLSHVVSCGPTSPSKAGALAPENKMPPPTPVTLTMTTAKWLRTVISPLPSEPTPTLQEFLRTCDRDLTEEVQHRAKVILEAIFHPRGSLRVYSGGMDNTWIEQRRQEAAKLYYKVLCTICTVEANRLQSNNQTDLLSNDMFHRCMLACSAELVLASHKTVVMTFPAVLEPSGITAFDLMKVTETFVRHEDLPRELKRHLNNIDERIVESMAWEKGSSIYKSLALAKQHLAGEIARMGLLGEPTPSLDSLAAPTGEQQPTDAAAAASPEREPQSMQPGNMASPIRPSAFSAFNTNKRNGVSQLRSNFASPRKPNPSGHGETCAENAINVFFEKVLKLAAIRIKSLCERLGQPVHIIEHAYRLFHYVLHKVTSIFFNRHIDQVVLSALYGVAKVLKIRDISFRSIIFEYRKQPQCKSYIFRSVPLDPRRASGKPGHETGDIIKFYNEYFVPAAKPLLITLNPPQQNGGRPAAAAAAAAPPPPPDANNTAPASPRPSAPAAFPSVPDMSPKKVSAKHNVYVTPLRSTKQVENIMSPHSVRLYACVGESTHAYQSPSKDLTAINNRLNNRRFGGRLDFDASLVSDSFVAGEFCPQIPANSADHNDNNNNNNNHNGNDHKRSVPPSTLQSSPKRPKLDR